MSGKTGKKSLIEWAKTTQPYRGGGRCATCMWLENNPVAAELDAVLKQIYTKQITISVAAVARKLKEEHGYRWNENTFAGHVRRCRPDLAKLAETTNG